MLAQPVGMEWTYHARYDAIVSRLVGPISGPDGAAGTGTGN